jgi:hypothetical protein
VTLVVQGQQGRAVATTAAVPPLPSRFRPRARRRALRREQWAWERDQRLAWHGQEVFAGLGLVTGQSSIAVGQTVSIPHVIQVHHGPPVSLIVRILPGQVAEDFAERSGRIAQNMGVARVRVVSLGPAMIRLELLETDPLAQTVPLPLLPLASSMDLVLLGMDDVANRYRITPYDLVHLAVQGTTGSGKSVFVYGLLAQLVTAPDLLIAMSDPTGLLARPFAGTVHEEWQVSGTADIAAHVDLLERLVDLMDQRIETLPPRQDQVDITDDCALIVAVFEEYAGLIRAATAHDAGKKAGGVTERIKLLVARLLSEGRKAGIRLVIIAQRFEASVIGGYEREQCTIKLSFRVGNATSIEMLHPAGRPEAEQHATSPPGIALLSAPGVPLVRVKSPYLGEEGQTAYATYWDAICATAARLPANRP